MSDVLSQSEIDALLNRLGTGEIELTPEGTDAPFKLKEYDFRTANRFHKEQIRTLNIIYDTFARLFASYLSGTLRVMCGAEVISVEELKYQEFVNALPSPVILAILRHPPMVGPVLLEISPDISYAMISRLLGGAPQQSALTTRAFTEIELVLIERVIRQFLSLFAESWEKIAPISVSLDRIETSPQFAQIVASNETVAIITFSVKIGSVDGLINICLPHLALEPINSQLTTKLLYQSVESGRHSEPARDEITARIRTTSLDLTAVFNATNATVREILELSEGDVLQLDHHTTDPLTVMVGHLPKFRGHVGLKSARYAVKIAEVIHKEELE